MKKTWRRVGLAVLLVLILSEIGLRLYDFPGDKFLLRRFGGYFPAPALFVPENCAPAGTIYRSNAVWENRLQMEAFPKHKSSPSLRVIFAGASTVAGAESRSSYPYLFSWKAAGRQRRTEVINAGLHQADLRMFTTAVPELLRYDPDVVVLETGTNEFINRARYPEVYRQGRFLHLVRSNLARSYLWRIIEMVMIPEPTAGDSDWSWLDEQTKRQAEEEFQTDLEAIVHRLSGGGKRKVILVTPAFWNDSEAGFLIPEGIPAAERRILSEATARLAEGNPAGALELLEKATPIRSRKASQTVHVIMAQAYENMGRAGEAFGLRRQAADMSPRLLQASTAMVEVIRRVAASVPGIKLIDGADMAKQAAIDGKSVFDRAGGYSESFALKIVELLVDQVFGGSDNSERKPEEPANPIQDYAETVSLPAWPAGVAAIDTSAREKETTVFRSVRQSLILIESGDRDSLGELTGLFGAISESALTVPLLLRARDASPFLVPVLIEALRSPRLRYPALQALMCSTGSFNSFEDGATGASVGECIRQWEKWWDEHGRARAVVSSRRDRKNLVSTIREYIRGNLLVRAAAAYIIQRELQLTVDPLLPASGRAEQEASLMEMISRNDPESRVYQR